jgi:hypothetical protein
MQQRPDANDTMEVQMMHPTAPHSRRRRAGFLLSHPARAAAAACFGLAVLLAGCDVPAPARAADAAADAGSDADGVTRAAESELEAIRAATERFRDVDVAVAEGYIRDPADMCFVPAMEGQPQQLGGMGVHYFRPDLLAITGVEPRVTGAGTHTDFTQPGLLLYEPQADGSLELIGVENLVFADAWMAAGNTTAPSFLGNEYYLMYDNPYTEADEAHGFAPHYELHVWLYRTNPSGTFAQFNPGVTCSNHGRASRIPTMSRLR